jgi:2'-5' RNA ligase
VSDLRSALIVEVPEAYPTHAWLERTAAAKPSAGVPAHVTVLFPFVPAHAIDDALVDDLTELFAGHEPFAFELRECRHFPHVLYLAPEPEEPFRRLTESVAAAYPEHPPYGGVFEDVVPHLTVAEGDRETLLRAEGDVRQWLPLAAQADVVTLLEEVEPATGRWQARTTFALGRERLEPVDERGEDGERILDRSG